MKWILYGLGALAVTLAALLGYGFLSHSPKTPSGDSDDIDGGVIHHSSGDESPKSVSSNEIVEFECEFSLLTYVDPTKLERANYKICAQSDGVCVNGSLERNNRCTAGEKHTFESDPSFMKKLCDLVIKHDLAEFNGYTHRVSGLPDMYGMKLDIRYASGEYIYTFDNQNNRLSLEAMEDLVALFEEEYEKQDKE